LAIGVSACAQDVGDIDRTQPNKVKKSIFQDDSEWYFEQTVVDTSVEGQSGRNLYGEQVARPIFSGMKNRRMKRIKWDIKENVLYAKATVEPVRGLTEQTDGEDHNQLGIVAAFPIDEHFDVQRQYNPQTGEPTNVIVEDRSDREWDEREYMRVDWSTNLVTSFFSIGDGLGRLSAKERTEKKREIPQDKAYSNPARTRISEDYVETTTEYVFDPDVIACQSNFGPDSIYHCEGATAKVRSSFMKVPDKKTYKPMQYRGDEPLMKPSSDYEPMKSATTVIGNQGFSLARCNNETINDQNREFYGQEPSEFCSDASFSYFDRFGYFRTETATWNEDYGTYDKGRKQWANRWNIWETMYDDSGNLIPAEQRTPEPIVYYMNAEYPSRLFEEAQMVADEWNEMFMESVRLAKGYDSNDQVVSDLQDAGYESGRMFKIAKNGCHPEKIVEWHEDQSPQDVDRDSVDALIEEYAGSTSDLESNLREMPSDQRKQLCSELEWVTNKRAEKNHPFTWQRRGDLRHSFFTYIHDAVGYLGYGPLSADPKTGEIISATANFAGRLLGRIATQQTDTLQYLNGDLTRNEIEEGLHVRRNLDDDGNPIGEEAQQALTPPEASKASQLARNDRTGPVKRLDVQEQIDRLNASLKKNADGGLAQAKSQYPMDYLEPHAYRAVQSARAANVTDTEMMKFYERPEIKNLLLSNPMTADTVNALAVERHGQTVLESGGTNSQTPSAGASGEEGKAALHQAYLDLYQPLVRERQRERTQRMLAKHNIYTPQAGERLGRGIALYTGAADYLKDASRPEIRDFFVKRIFFGTMLHEIGHTVGLRHNFESSMDPMNFHDGFWQIQGQQVECDSETEGCDDGTLTLEEARSGGPELAELVNDNPYADFVNKSEFKTGSVMDYAPTGGNIAGLGKYDQAAINFAYAKHVEKWDDDIQLSPLYEITQDRAQYEQIPALLADESHQEASGACKSSPFAREPDPECVKEGIDIILEGREWVSIDEAKQHKVDVLQNNTNLATGDGSSEGVMNERLVDYEFCSDERRGGSLNCEVFDWGANQVEVLTYAFEEYRTMQPFERYRGAEIGAGNDVVRGAQGALLDALSLADTPFRYFSFYRALDYDIGALTDDLEKAARLGLNFYGEVLTKPKPGRHCTYEPNDLSTPGSPGGTYGGTAIDVEGAYIVDDAYYRADTLQDKCEDDTTMSLEEGPAQYFGYKWSDEYYYRLNRVGTFIDKVTASSRIFQLRSNFTFSNFTTDLRATNISYWTEFEDPLYRMLRSLFLGDYGNFGSAMTEEGEFVPYQLVDPVTGESNPNASLQNEQRIYDPTSFDVRLNLLIGAIAEYSTWQDNKSDFDEYTVIAASEKERQLLPDNLPSDDKAVFVHPDTNRKYVAIRAPDGRSISHELVEWANDLKNELVTLRNNGDEEAAQEIKEDLENVVAKMNLIREIRAVFNPEG
jgi:hypothetical protein